VLTREQLIERWKQVEEACGYTFVGVPEATLEAGVLPFIDPTDAFDWDLSDPPHAPTPEDTTK
jgi:hypothetical protein